MCAVYTQALVKAQIYTEDHKSSPPHCLLQGHLEGPEFVVSLQHKHDGRFKKKTLHRSPMMTIVTSHFDSGEGSVVTFYYLQSQLLNRLAVAVRGEVPRNVSHR